MLTKTVIENIFIILGEGFWLFNNFAQLKKLVRTRNTKGLVALTQTAHAAGNVAWITYFVSQRLWVPFSSNIGLLIMTMATIGYLLSNKKQFEGLSQHCCSGSGCRLSDNRVPQFFRLDGDDTQYAGGSSLAVSRGHH